MRQQLLPIFLSYFVVALLTACGSADRVGMLQANQSTIGRITQSTPLVANMIFGTCRALVTYSETNDSTVQQFSGANACPSTTPAGTYIKVNLPNLPSGTAICVFPLTAAGVLGADVCGTTSGTQVTLNLGTTNYTEVVVVKNSDRTAYWNYANYYDNNYPTMAHGQVR